MKLPQPNTAQGQIRGPRSVYRVRWAQRGEGSVYAQLTGSQAKLTRCAQLGRPNIDSAEGVAAALRLSLGRQLQLLLFHGDALEGAAHLGTGMEGGWRERPSEQGLRWYAALGAGRESLARTLGSAHHCKLHIKGAAPTCARAMGPMSISWALSSRSESSMGESSAAQHAWWGQAV